MKSNGLEGTIKNNVIRNYSVDPKSVKIDKMSVGEKLIAQFLTQYNIPFEFEKPVAVYDGGKTKLWHPDFTLHQHGNVIIEYFGLSGKSADYDNSIEHKLGVYDNMNMKVVSIFPNELNRGIYRKRIMDEVGSHMYFKTREFDSIYGKFKRKEG